MNVFVISSSFSTMFRSLIFRLALNSLEPLKRNKLLSSRPREQNSRLNKPCKTKSRPLLRRLVRLRPPRCWVKLCRLRQLSSNWEDWKLLVTLPRSCPNLETASTSNLTRCWWTLHSLSTLPQPLETSEDTIKLKPPPNENVFSRECVLQKTASLRKKKQQTDLLYQKASLYFQLNSINTSN